MYGANKMQIVAAKNDNSFQEVVKRNSLDKAKTFTQSELDVGFSIHMTDVITGKFLTKEDTEGIYEDWTASIRGFNALTMSETKNQNLEMDKC